MSSARSAVRTSPAPRAGSPGNRRWHAGDVVKTERDDDIENADLSNPEPAATAFLKLDRSQHAPILLDAYCVKFASRNAVA
jgi:hypothetical protein